MTGLDETHFGSTQDLARAQFASILYRIMSKTSLKILQSVSAGIINHFESGENDYKKLNEK